LATAKFVAGVCKLDPLDMIGDDKPAELLFRSATDPATLTSSTWAAPFALATIDDLIPTLSPPSACAALIAAGMRVNLVGRAGGVTVAGRVVDPNDCGSFVLEGSPIPVRTLPLSGPTLVPRKLAVIVTLTDETATYTDAERVIRQLLSEAAALRLDVEMLSTTAASTSRPAGLLNNVVAITAATAAADAMSKDIGALLSALSTAGGGQQPFFIANPAQAAALKLRAGTNFDYPVRASAALAAGTVVCIESGSFVSGFSPVPEIDVAAASTLHMEDTPLPIVDGSTKATPVRSAFQTGCRAIRLVLRCAWAMRATGHVQIVNSVSW
jgi:hypothetical protein